MKLKSVNGYERKFKEKNNWFIIIVVLLFVLFPILIKNNYIIDVAFFFGI
jgi:uncharacterized integral membrane protein